MLSELELVVEMWESRDPQCWIPIEFMTDGYYVCSARNFVVGKWNGTTFEYIRTKFGKSYPDTEEHWDHGSPHGTVRPIRYLGEHYEY